MSRSNCWTTITVERERQCPACRGIGGDPAGTCIRCDGDGKEIEEIELEVRGQFVRGCRATGPSYSCGGTPAEPDMVEDIEASKDGGKTWDFELTDDEVEEAEEAMLEGYDGGEPEYEPPDE